MQFRSKLISLVTILSIAFISTAQSQNFKEDIKKINLAYKDATISSEVKYEYFPTHTSAQPSNVENAQIRVKQGKYYLKFDKIELIKNSTLSLYIDHGEKTITLMPADKTAPDMDILTMNLESATKECKKIDFIKSGKINQYILTMPENAEYKMVKVSFYGQSFLLDKIELYYNETSLQDDQSVEGGTSMPRVVISYTNSKEVPDSVFSHSTFIKSANGKYSLQEKFKNYELISHL